MEEQKSVPRDRCLSCRVGDCVDSPARNTIAVEGSQRGTVIVRKGKSGRQTSVEENRKENGKRGNLAQVSHVSSRRVLSPAELRSAVPAHPYSAVRLEKIFP